MTESKHRWRFDARLRWKSVQDQFERTLPGEKAEEWMNRKDGNGSNRSMRWWYSDGDDSTEKDEPELPSRMNEERTRVGGEAEVADVRPVRKKKPHFCVAGQAKGHRCYSTSDLKWQTSEMRSKMVGWSNESSTSPLRVRLCVWLQRWATKQSSSKVRWSEKGGNVF